MHFPSCNPKFQLHMVVVVLCLCLLSYIWIITRTAKDVELSKYLTTQTEKTTEYSNSSSIQLRNNWSVKKENVKNHTQYKLSTHLVTALPQNRKYVLLESFLVRPYWNSVEYKLLPDLTAISWPQVQYNKEPIGLSGHARYPPPFEPVISRGERNLFKRLLQLFAQVLSSNGFGDRFIINAGTLHGSLRHHDFIPYDDDVDACVEYTILPKVQQLFQAYEPEYKLIPNQRRAKLQARLIPVELQQLDVEYSRNTSNSPWLYPAVDICYYVINDTHVYEKGAPGNTRTFPKSVFFPLLFRPLGDRWYPTPFNPIQYIRIMAPQSKYCIRVDWDHAFEAGLDKVDTPCTNLRSRYAFVERSRSDWLLTSSTYPNKLLNQLVVGRERLILASKTKPNEPIVYHTLNLPMHRDLASLDTYDYGKNNAE